MDLVQPVSELLSLKYRPRTFEDMIGQDMVALVLDRMVQKDLVPSGLLFTGIHGTGKTTAARILARALNPDVADLPVVEVDAASNGGVAEVRALVDSMRYGVPGRYRVVIVDEAHSMSRDAFNALLKPLEEPPANTIWVLVTTEPEKIPKTILSRLMTFEFRKVSPLDIYDRLAHIIRLEGFDFTFEDALVRHIADRADGSVRNAIMTLDLVARAGVENLSSFKDLQKDSDLGPTLLKLMIDGDKAALFAWLDDALMTVSSPAVLLDKVVLGMRDLFVLRAGGALKMAGTQLERRKVLASLVGTEQLTAAIKILWDVKTRLRFNENTASNFTLAVLLVSEVLSRGSGPTGG